MPSTAKLLCVATMILLLPACMRQIHITSNTFADRSIPNGFPRGSRFAITYKYGGNQLFAKEVRNKIADQLHKCDYATADESNADYILVFSFGSTQSKAQRSVPVFIPGKDKTKLGALKSNHDFVQYEERTASTGSTVYVQEEFDLYNHELHIIVFDAAIYRKTHEEEQCWQASVINSSELYDSREIIDYLIAAAFKQFGRNTNKIIHETFSMR